LVTYQSQGVAHGIDLQYSSLQANPLPVVQSEPVTQTGGASGSIQTISSQLTIGGVIQGNSETYTPPTGFQDLELYRASYQGNAAGLSTGIYSYQLATSHNFSGSSLTGTLGGNLDVVNASASPYGAGWSIGGLQRISSSGSTGPALITAGSQGTEEFDYR